MRLCLQSRQLQNPFFELGPIVLVQRGSHGEDATDPDLRYLIFVAKAK